MSDTSASMRPSGEISRRQLTTAAVWSVPVIMLAVSTPSVAASGSHIIDLEWSFPTLSAPGTATLTVTTPSGFATKPDASISILPVVTGGGSGATGSDVSVTFASSSPVGVFSSVSTGSGVTISGTLAASTVYTITVNVSGTSANDGTLITADASGASSQLMYTYVPAAVIEPTIYATAYDEDWAKTIVWKIAPTMAPAHLTVGLGGSPAGLCISPTGDLYICDAENKRIVKKAAGTGIETYLGEDLENPFGITLSAAGDLYITDAHMTTNTLVKITSDGVQTVIKSGLQTPCGVAVNSTGDVYVASMYNNQVLKIAAKTSVETLFGTNLGQPYGVALNAAGDVFIADYGNSNVVVIRASDGAQSIFTSDCGGPYGVAVSESGDVFVADQNNDRVVKVTADGLTTTYFDTPYGTSAVAVLG